MSVTLRKKIAPNIVIGAWNYNNENCMGQCIGIKESADSAWYRALIQVENIKTKEGSVNRIKLNKDRINQFGFIIVEE